MKVVNHRLEGVRFVQSPNVSGLMTPAAAIMHYTASFDAAGAIRTLTNPAAKVSAHLVIDTDGTITQLVPFNRIAWHAGPSRLNGRQGVNNFSIGFEFVNPGFFRIGANGQVMDWRGQTPISQSVLNRFDLSLRAPNRKIGGGTFIWPGYSKAQIDAGLSALRAIVAAYNITDVAGHEDIDTRGWKTDPGPAFPMGLFKEVLHGGSDRSDGLQPARSRFLVNTPRLNVRAGPNTNSAVITTLNGGSEVIVLRDLGAWSEVEYAPGKRGYVADQFLKKG